MKYCWTKVEQKLREKFDEYRRMNLFTDVTLIATNNGGGEEKFAVHRIILSAISPYVLIDVHRLYLFCVEKNLILVRKDVLKFDD